MATLKVQPDDMDALVQSMRAAATEIQSEIDGLRSTASWLATQWTGEAAKAYQERQRAWCNEATEHRWTLSELADALADIRLRYVHAETKVVEECS